ncbi:protein-L-isoaspartate O-methyltransferase family protein, partial [Chromobacterium haemolyticum]
MDFENARFNMVEQQIRPWDVLDTNVLDLLFHVKREQFVAADKRSLAFVDTELPLPNGSFMLQPKMEARLVQDAAIQAKDKILEIGTGSGYLTALLAKLGQHVYSVEIDPAQRETAAANLKQAGISNVTLVEGDGVLGLPQQAPFDVIVVGGSLPVVPQELKDQLAVGGRLI